MKISVIVPIYNEEENIDELYARLKTVLYALPPEDGNGNGNEYEMIFVDDGSTDATPGLLEKIRNSDSRVLVINFRRNFGQTAAFAAGFDYASGEVIITM